MNFLKFAAFLVLTILLQGSILAQDWVSYRSPQQINDLADTGNELLMATDHGLVVLNKSTLDKTFFTKANSNLSNNHIQAIAQAPDGTNWIGTYDVILTRVDGSGFQDNITPVSSFFDSNTMLYDFEIAPNGDFWLGTTDGIFHKQGQNWFHYDEADLDNDFFEPWDIAIDDNGDVFVASLYLYKFSGGVWTNISASTNLMNYLDADLFFNSNGDLYMAGDLDKVGRFDGTQWEEYEHPLNGSQIKGFTEDTNGNMYFQSQYDGIFKLENSTWTPQTDAQAAAYNNTIAYFYIDAENNRWMNKNIHLSVNTNGNIQSTLIAPHTLEVNGNSSVSKDENGSMYFLTGSRDNISVVDTDGDWTFIPLPASTMFFAFLNDILAISNEDIFLATSVGLYHYNGSNWMLTNANPGRRLAVDSQGKIYVLGYDSNLYIIENGVVITAYDMTNSPLSAPFVSGHGIDAADNLWIAEQEINAIHKVSSTGVWTTYTAADYPAINKPRGDFHFDSNGNTWVPSDLIGAIKFDGTTFTNPFVGNLGLFDNYNAFSIESDAAGKMYFAHQYGVTTLLNDEWEDVLIEDVPNENSSARAIVEFDNEGTLWWASDRHGVFTYTPQSISSTSSEVEMNANYTIYPNPAGSYVILDFVCPTNAMVGVRIYNNLGQLTSSLDLGQLPAGANQQKIEVGHFPKGMYFVQLEINNNSSTKTIIVE